MHFISSDSPDRVFSDVFVAKKGKEIHRFHNLLSLVYFLLSFRRFGKEYAIVLFNLDLKKHSGLSTVNQSLMLPEHDRFSHKK